MIPDSFKRFLEQNDIDVDIYLKQLKIDLPRYIKIHHKYANEIDLQTLEKEFNIVQQVSWMKDFYALPSDVSIANSALYQQGKVYSMDVASAFAVKALNVEPDDHVLDLCCAPGMKLLCIADILERDQDKGYGTVTGVDISRQRLSNCKSLMRKYGVQRGRLYCEDGSNFDVYAPSSVGAWKRQADLDSVLTKSRVQCVKPPFHATKLLRYQTEENNVYLYDKVIVDAECTHDGSIAHIRKYNDQQFSRSSFDNNVLDEKRLFELKDIQRNLLNKGFQMLKKGGILVYSTCSFSRFQNEEVVSWLLKKYPTTVSLVQVFNASQSPTLAPSLAYLYPEHPEMIHVVRMDPIHSGTSGLFIAKFKKK